MEKLKVLIVDDMKTARNFIKYGLDKNHGNMEVDEASNGKEAQAKIEARKYDLILCDWEMPAMTGDELLNWVRGNEATKDIKFIMITAKSDKESVIKALNAGVSGYLVKPFTIEGLLQKMTDVDRKFDRRFYERFAISGNVTLHFRDSVARGGLLDLSAGGLLGNFPRKGALPQILEKVVANMKVSDNRAISGLECFVVRIQAADAFIDSEYIKVAVKFMDMTGPKAKELKDYISAMAVSGTE